MSDLLLERWYACWFETHGSEMQLATHPDTDDLYRWEGGVWRPLTPRFARTVMIESGWSPTRHGVEEALFQATNCSPYLRGNSHDLEGREPRINFKNGVLDLASGHLIPHGEPWHTINQIPHDYRDDLTVEDLELATLPLDQFLKERLAPDTWARGVLWQVLGSAMLPGNPNQSFVILQGPGGSGKGTFLRLLQDVIGEENATSLTLKQLESRFAVSSLHGRLANVAGDVSGGVVPGYELIHSITGGDRISADRKYRIPLEFVWKGQLILATNGRLALPAGAGSESGWWRRAIYIDMPNAVRTDDRISPAELQQAIAPDLDVVSTRAAHAIRTAWQAGQVPTVTPSMAHSSAMARMTGNTVADWCNDALAPDPAGRVIGKEAYDHYAIWCEYFGHRPKGHRAFYEDLERILNREGWGGRDLLRTESSRAIFHGVAFASSTASNVSERQVAGLRRA